MNVNKRQSQQRKDFKSDGMSADFKGERVFHISVRQRREIAERIKNGAQPRLISAEIENHHENKSRHGVIKIDCIQQDNACNEQPPLFFFKAPCCCKAYDQREENIQIENIARDIVRIKSQNSKRL